MKLKTTKQENQEKKYAKAAVGADPEDQGETSPIVMEEAMEVLNKIKGIPPKFGELLERIL